MMTDEELTDGLRDELRQVHVPSDLLDRLRAEAANDRLHLTPQSPRRQRGRRRSLWTWVAAAASLALVGAIVAVVLSVGHREQQQSTVSGTESPRARLIASFAVLRRQQGPKDLQPGMFVYHQRWSLTRAKMERAG